MKTKMGRRDLPATGKSEDFRKKFLAGSGIGGWRVLTLATRLPKMTHHQVHEVTPANWAKTLLPQKASA